MRYARLLCISAGNHNKVYEMHERAGGTFEAHYGRVGAAAQVRTYSMAEWETKHREKLRKGYRDVTGLAVVAPSGPRHLPIADPDVADVMARFERAAQAHVGAHYDVQVAAVTAQMLAEAEAHLDRLARLARGLRFDADATNAALVDLYHAIPRRMTRVADHLAADRVALRERLAREQDLLDTLRTQVVLARPDAAPTQTLLDALGLTLRPATLAETLRVRAHVGFEHQGAVRRVFAARHAATAARYDAARAQAACPDERLLWHGSRTANWLSIFRTGLVLHPTSAVVTGKMFGYGLYFADRFAKSLGYTDARGSVWARGADDTAYLALFRVHTGRRHEVHAWEPALARTTRADLPAGTDSLHAHGGADLRHDEYIVYDEAQATLAYLVEVAV